MLSVPTIIYPKGENQETFLEEGFHWTMLSTLSAATTTELSTPKGVGEDPFNGGT